LVPKAQASRGCHRRSNAPSHESDMLLAQFRIIDQESHFLNVNAATMNYQMKALFLGLLFAATSWNTEANVRSLPSA
jgi:hypothetical protein